MSITAGAVESWAREIGSTMAALPSELQQAAPQGTFARVLQQAAAVLDASPAATTPAATTPAATAPLVPVMFPTASASSMTTASSFVSAPGIAGDRVFASGAAGSPGSTSGDAVVSEAERFLGVPYVWGGDTPSGFDCSGLVQYVYGHIGVQLPRTTYTQVKVGSPVAGLTQAQPGDLVFFAGSDGTPTSPGHVGIYIGNGKMIDAPYTGTVVQVQTVTSAGPVVAIRRILPGTGAMTVPADFGLTAAASATPTSAGPVAVPSKLAPLFVAAGARYGVSPTLLAAIARRESGFSPDAVSTRGAEGMMQFMPGTAAGLGITPFTPSQAVEGGARLVAGYIRQFGSVPLALAAYNAGPGAVQGYGGIPPYPQTQAYVAAIMKTVGAAS